MEDFNSGSFLSTWHQIMILGAIGSVILALLIYVYHNVKVASIAEYKQKYDYLRENEIKFFKICLIILAIGTAMIINTYGKNSLKFDPIWFFVRIFISVAGGTLVGYIGSLILQYYYPTRLNKKLKKWRYMPRVNKDTGAKMRLLREDEEDVHLDEGMQAEEEAFSIDYDVWIDEATGHTQVEKYPGHLQALQCNNCGFYTMKVAREEIIQSPTETTEGELVKHYECQYCGSIRATQHHIAKEEDYSSYKPDQLKFKTNTEVDFVKIDIVSNTGQKKSYEFQSVDQAEKFLAEFDMESSN